MKHKSIGKQITAVETTTDKITRRGGITFILSLHMLSNSVDSFLDTVFEVGRSLHQLIVHPLYITGKFLLVAAQHKFSSSSQR